MLFVTVASFSTMRWLFHPLICFLSLSLTLCVQISLNFSDSNYCRQRCFRVIIVHIYWWVLPWSPWSSTTNITTVLVVWWHSVFCRVFSTPPPVFFNFFLQIKSITCVNNFFFSECKLFGLLGRQTDNKSNTRRKFLFFIPTTPFLSQFHNRLLTIH